MSKLPHIIKIIALSFPLSSTAVATSIQPGDLFISEVMANPNAVSDSNGEWFEIFNSSVNTIDLDGLVISDDGANSHQINSGSSLLVAPGEYFVFGTNGDSTLNGGYIADYVYNNFSLTNSSDQIILSENSIEIARLDYSGTPFGISGRSAELINQILNPSQADYLATLNQPIFQYGDGDFGTPGAPGSVALTTASPVPLPSTIWLFTSTLLLTLRRLTI